MLGITELFHHFHHVTTLIFCIIALYHIFELDVLVLTGTEKDVTDADVKALEKVLDLVKEFAKKNPIKRRKIKFDRVDKQVLELINNESSRKELFWKEIRKLKGICQREIRPQLYLIVGGHGGIIIDGVGYCEFDAPSFAIDRLLERMQLAVETNMPLNLEIAVSCLEWLNKHYPERITEFLELFKKGRFEILNPSYSQPYNLLIGPESNIKQFERGMRVLKQLGLPCDSYYCSEASLHPQIPQLLKGFNIKFGSIRTRLLGQTPTTHSGHVHWLGLDNTSIDTLTDQAGVFNGETWHGTFFLELPTLLFQAVARPFIKQIIYSSIEDFINELPYQAEVWRVSQFADLFGTFVGFSEAFKHIELDGEFKFRRDEFALGDYIFIPGELFLNNKQCEIDLICAEILHCVLGHFQDESDEKVLEELWGKFLLTQAHDCYAVPFIHPGDYSAQQLSPDQYKTLEYSTEKMAISELSVALQKAIQSNCRTLISQGLEALAQHLVGEFNSQESPVQIIVFNPTPVSRQDIVSIPMNCESASDIRLVCRGKLCNTDIADAYLEFIAEIPPLGYAIYSLAKNRSPQYAESGKFFYSVKLKENLKVIEIFFNKSKVYELEFESQHDYKLSIEAHSRGFVKERYKLVGKMGRSVFRLEIIQYSGVNRLEYKLESGELKEIILRSEIPVSKAVVNYPFGIEETKRTKIQTLDFLWLRGEENGILFMIKNSQRFLIDRKNFTIRNVITPRGRFEFAITATTEKKLHSALADVTAFQFRLLGKTLEKPYSFPKDTGSFLTLPPPIQLINFWRRDRHVFLRVFNPSYCDQEIKISTPLASDSMKEVDLSYEEVGEIQNRQLKIQPWKIKTLLL
jgi:hypothetical protein